MKSIQIIPFKYFDHDAVQIKIIQKQQKRGPGYWKLNTSILKHHNYKNAIKKFWQDWQNPKQNYDTITQWWDVAKLYIIFNMILNHTKPKYKKSSRRGHKQNIIGKTKRSPKLK